MPKQNKQERLEEIDTLGFIEEGKKSGQLIPDCDYLELRFKKHIRYIHKLPRLFCSQTESVWVF